MTNDERYYGSKLDKVILRIIATLQSLGALLCLLMVPFVFMYGGAAAWPSRFYGILWYLVAGLGLGVFLSFGALAARILALLWQLFLVGFLLSTLIQSPEPADKHPLLFAVVLQLLLSCAYLAATSAAPIAAAVRQNRQRARRLALVGSSMLLLFWGLYWFFQSTVKGLELQLQTTQGQRRCILARRLGAKGAAASAALPALKSMLDDTMCDDYGEFEDRTVADIANIGGIDALIDVMKNGRTWGRQAAYGYVWQTMRNYPNRGPELRELFHHGLQDKDAVVREFSVEALGDMGAYASDLAPDIEKLADDSSAQVREVVPAALGKLHSSRGLSDLIDNSNQQIRAQAIQEIDSRHLGADAVTPLIQALTDKSGSNAAAAAAALGNLHRQALPALQALENAALNSSDASTRLAAIHALWQIGPEGRPGIQRALSDNDEQVRNHAISLLATYGEDGVAALAEFLDEPWSSSSAHCADVLGELGPRAVAALDALQRTALSSPDSLTRIVAIGALAKIGPQGFATVSKATEDSDPKVSLAATSALRGMRSRYPQLPRQ